MFTGIVESMATVEKVVPEPPGKRLVLRQPEEFHSSPGGTDIGQSIALNGCCLTVIASDTQTIAFEAGPETLLRTNLGEFSPGSPVNVERSLCVGDRLGGHFVSGHIDCVAALDKREDDKEWSTLWFRVPAQFMSQIVSKGSIAVDGVSLTLVDVEEQRFSVALIPHTLEVTTLGKLQFGDRVNLETDLLAKYVQKQLESRL